MGKFDWIKVTKVCQKFYMKRCKIFFYSQEMQNKIYNMHAIFLQNIRASVSGESVTRVDFLHHFPICHISSFFGFEALWHRFVGTFEISLNHKRIQPYLSAAIKEGGLRNSRKRIFFV